MVFHTIENRQYPELCGKSASAILIEDVLSRETLFKSVTRAFECSRYRLAQFVGTTRPPVYQRWQREEPTDGGQHGKCSVCSVIPYHRCHSSPSEHEESEKTHQQ
jgi:hypothetical protein